MKRSVLLILPAVLMLGGPPQAAGQSGTGIYVLSPTADARFSGTVNVVTSHIYVNSTAHNAFNPYGSAEVTALSANVVGGTTHPENFVGTLNDNTGAPVGDPLAHVPLPTWDHLPDLGEVVLNSGKTVLSPGFYSGGITLTSSAQVEFLPGLYVLGGAGLDTSGQTSIRGIDVTLFVTGTGKVDMSGQGKVLLAPARGGEYDDILFFVDRRTGGSVDITGGSEFVAHGQMYAPSSNVRIRGNGGTGGDPKMGFLLVCKELDLSGNGGVSFIRWPSPEDCYD